VRVLVRRPTLLLPKRRQRRIALVMRGVRRTSGWELHFLRVARTDQAIAF